jgi:hypothetical protein
MRPPLFFCDTSRALSQRKFDLTQIRRWLSPIFFTRADARLLRLCLASDCHGRLVDPGARTKPQFPVINVAPERSF